MYVVLAARAALVMPVVLAYLWHLMDVELVVIADQVACVVYVFDLASDCVAKAHAFVSTVILRNPHECVRPCTSAIIVCVLHT